MEKRMEISHHCWKFIYKQVYSLYVTDFIFFFFLYLHKSGKNIFTNKSSSSGIYQYFNGCVRRVKTSVSDLTYLRLIEAIFWCSICIVSLDQSLFHWDQLHGAPARPDSMVRCRSA